MLWRTHFPCTDNDLKATGHYFTMDFDVDFRHWLKSRWFHDLIRKQHSKKSEACIFSSRESHTPISINLIANAVELLLQVSLIIYYFIGLWRQSQPKVIQFEAFGLITIISLIFDCIAKWSNTYFFCFFTTKYEFYCASFDSVGWVCCCSCRIEWEHSRFTYTV